MTKHTIVIDFETYYDREYSLTKMPMQTYVNSNQFEVIGYAYRLDDEPIQWVPGGTWDSGKVLRDLPWEDATCVAHNAQFDGLILETYGVQPAKYFCTQMAAKPVLQHKTGSVSLKACAEYLGVGQKGEEVHNAIGKRFSDFSVDELARYSEYCKNDVHITWWLYHIFTAWFGKHDTSGDELDIIDDTIKKFTRPSLLLSNGTLRTRLQAIKKEKTAFVQTTGAAPEDFRSDIKFASLLRHAGVPDEDIPRKKSPTTGAPVYAFAKNDPGMKKLRNHPDKKIQVLAKGRLLFKSSIEESRLERLLTLNGEFPHAYNDLCVPLLYYGAHTGRFSGKDFINLQNLGRGGVLREAIVAPQGHKIVAADLSQIEARMTAAFCGQDDLVEQFRNGEDVYANFASRHYGFEVNANDHPKERFVGKTGILSLGYQSGHMKFYETMNYVFDTPISAADAESVVKTYRNQYRKIRAMWYELNDCIPLMAQGKVNRKIGPITLAHQKIILPNGMPINYYDLKRDPITHDWSYTDGRKRVKLYGGKMLENIVQALARIVMTTAQMKLTRHNRPSALSVHDELVFVVKEENAALVAAAVKAVMEDVVPWMPDLPVACEAQIGDNYAECK